MSKGPDILIEVIKLYKKTYSKLAVVLAGYRRQYVIKKLKELNIKYYYFENIDKSQLNKLYNSLNLYVVSSRVEGGPRAIVESAITKTPIISTNVGIVSEILDSKSIYKNSESAVNSIPNVDYAYNNVINLIILIKCFLMYINEKDFFRRNFF